eukprot:TRINITY_DN50087_c0_g3_i1.p1 TRINITY_DN50087_c0_g3~~TRINITY_DN50087_c0_g3_i1.p1  ORF type:complete len:1055 (+),score=270.59 TRINITY_DN50087_c0_g3_i1:101-3265(+)
MPSLAPMLPLAGRRRAAPDGPWPPPPEGGEEEQAQASAPKAPPMLPIGGRRCTAPPLPGEEIPGAGKGPPMLPLPGRGSANGFAAAASCEEDEDAGLHPDSGSEEGALRKATERKRSVDFAEPLESDRPTARGKDVSGNFLDHYELHEMLGHGAFGQVHLCRSKRSGSECAVKMVDKVEAPLEDIKREADLQSEVVHPNIVRVLAVYYEKCFVCIVMELCEGGDLIEGIELRGPSVSEPEYYAVGHIAKQMVRSVRFLHSRDLMHRDIKGDNYLLDRMDMEDPHCRVLLTDFGTTLQLVEPAQRMQSRVGTKAYWSPEVWDGNYSVKADIWALGVTVHALLEDSLPFHASKQACRRAWPGLGADAPELCTDFVRGMLVEAEAERSTAEELLCHDWLSVAAAHAGAPTPGPKRGRTTTMCSEMGGSHADNEKHLREEAPDAYLNRRRQSLLGRMVKANEAQRHEAVDRHEPGGVPASLSRGSSILRRSTALGSQMIAEEMALFAFVNGIFEAVDEVKGHTHTFEWWPVQKAASAGLLRVQEVEPGSPSRWTGGLGEVGLVSRMLEDCGVDTEAFGQAEAKTLEEFASEVQSGASRLMLDAREHKKVVRVVEVVVLRLCFRDTDDSEKFCVEVGTMYPDGRQRQLARLPGTKREPHENTRMVCERIVRSLPEMQHLQLPFNLKAAQVFESEQESPSYPGVHTVYRKELVEALLPPATSMSPSLLEQLGVRSGERLGREDETRATRFFQWLTEAECEEAAVELEAPGDATASSAATATYFSSLVHCPVGLGLDILRDYLVSNGIDIERFGHEPGSKRLEELARELSLGECSLTKDGDGRLLRVVDMIVLRLRRRDTGELLVHTAETSRAGEPIERCCLPVGPRRAGENHFLAARTMLRRNLRIDENCVNLNNHDTRVSEEVLESSPYPGLLTLQRTRTIGGEVFLNQESGPQEAECPLFELFSVMDFLDRGLVPRSELLWVISSFVDAANEHSLMLAEVSPRLVCEESEDPDGDVTYQDFEKALEPIKGLLGPRKFDAILLTLCREADRKWNHFCAP